MNVIWRCEPPLYNHVSSPTLSFRDDKQDTGICGLTDAQVVIGTCPSAANAPCGTGEVEKSTRRADWCIRSSLQTATLNDRCEVVRTLLKLGADMEIKDAQVGVPYDGPNSTQAQERERTRFTLVALHLARCILHTQA